MARHGTGRLLHHDPASRNYEAPRRAVRPTSWLHRMGPVLDQGTENGCTGWTGADVLNSALAVGNRRRFWAQHAHPGFPTAYLGNTQGDELYRLATRNDPFDWTFPPTDNGSSGLGVLKALKQLGVIDQYLWTFDFANLLAWGQRQPVMIGTLWTDAMSDPDAKGVIHIGTPKQVKAAEDAGMGHEYSLRGVRWDRKLARIRNHWSEEWGIGGEALLPLDELETLVMKFQGDVAVPELVVAA